MTRTLAIDVRLAGTGGGISRYMDGVLAEIDKKSTFDRILLLGNQEESPYDFGEYRRLSGRFLSYYGMHLPRALLEDDVEEMLAPSAFLPLWRTCHTVTVLYDLYALKYSSLLTKAEALSYRGLAYRFRAFFHLLCLQQADAIVSISQSTAKDLQMFAPALAPRQEVIYCDVPQQFRMDIMKPRERFILYVGGFNTHKNVRSLIQAHAKLNERVSRPVSLVLAGYHGWPPVDIEAIVAAEGRADLIKVLIRPSDEEIIDLYQRCAAFAYLSAYEGFGLPVLEAIRCGAPVLVNDKSSLPELAPLEQCRVDVRDISAVSAALERLLEMDDNSSLVASLQQHAEKFSFASAAEAILDLLEDSVSPGRFRKNHGTASPV